MNKEKYINNLKKNIENISEYLDELVSEYEEMKRSN